MFKQAIKLNWFDGKECGSLDSMLEYNLERVIDQMWFISLEVLSWGQLSVVLFRHKEVVDISKDELNANHPIELSIMIIWWLSKYSALGAEKNVM